MDVGRGLVTALTIVVAVTTSCGSESPSEPRPTNLAPIETSTTAAPGSPAEVGATGLTVSLPELSADATVSQDEAIEAPVVAIERVPADTVALAVVATDEERGRIHWVVSGLESDTGEVDPASLPAGAIEYQNESGEFGWLPVIEAPARIRIRVLALEATVPPTPEDPTVAIPAFAAVAIDDASVVLGVDP